MRLIKTDRITVSFSGGEAALAGPSPAAGSVGILVAGGPDVSVRSLSDGDPLVKRIRNNPDILSTVYPDRICYLPAAPVRAFVASLPDVHVAELLVGDGRADVETAVSEAEDAVSSPKRLRGDSSLLKVVCGQWYRRMRLPVLLLYLAIVLANFLYYPSINRKYEERRRMLEVEQRRSRTESEVTERQRKLMTEFIGLSSAKTAVSFDRIAAAVPGDMRLTQLMRKEDGFHVKGETEEAASVLALADSLGARFGAMRILSYGIIPGKEMLGFEIVVRP